MKTKAKDRVRELCLERIVRFYEGANILAYVLKKMPVLKKKITDEWFVKENKTQKRIFGAIYFIGGLLTGFIKKIVYGLLFLYLPYRILGELCPNILLNQEKSILYFFLIINTICGSIVNTTFFNITDHDYIMLKLMKFNIKMYYLGRIFYKMITESVYYFLVLFILGVNIRYCFYLSIITMSLRPAGEVVALFFHTFLNRLHKRRESINGFLMAGAILYAYLVPYVNRDISDRWYEVGGVSFICGMLFAGFVSVGILYLYRRYDHLFQELVYKKKDIS